MVNVSDLRLRKAGNVQKKLKQVLPIWFSRLGICVKKKEAVSLFLESVVRNIGENPQFETMRPIP
jgi:hypothetical protein